MGSQKYDAGAGLWMSMARSVVSCAMRVSLQASSAVCAVITKLKATLVRLRGSSAFVTKTWMLLTALEYTDFTTLTETRGTDIIISLRSKHPP